MLQARGIAEILLTQLNVESYRIFEVRNATLLQKMRSLIENELPIVPTVFLVKKNVASRVRSDIDKVSRALERVDKLELIKSLETSGKYSLTYDSRQIDISSNDLEFSYTVMGGYTMSERDNLMVFIGTRRDKDLIIKGMLRDLARNFSNFERSVGTPPQR